MQVLIWWRFWTKGTIRANIRRFYSLWMGIVIELMGSGGSVRMSCCLSVLIRGLLSGRNKRAKILRIISRGWSSRILKMHRLSQLTIWQYLGCRKRRSILLQCAQRVLSSSGSPGMACLFNLESCSLERICKKLCRLLNWERDTFLWWLEGMIQKSIATRALDQCTEIPPSKNHRC